MPQSDDSTHALIEGLWAHLDERFDRLEDIKQLRHEVQLLKEARIRDDAIAEARALAAEETSKAAIIEAAEARGSWRAVVKIGAFITGAIGAIAGAIGLLVEYFKAHPPKGPNP